MVYIILACLLYSAAVLISTSASRNANTNIVSLVTNVVSVFIPLLAALPALSKKGISSHKYGVAMAALSGIVIGLYVLALNKSFSQNKVGIVTPIVYGGTILLSTLISYFIFKENISFTEAMGLVLVLAGIAVVGYARVTAG